MGAVQATLAAAGHTVALTFRAGKGTGQVEKSARFSAADGTVLAAYPLDTQQAYTRVLTALLEHQTVGFLRLPEAMRLLHWMVAARQRAVWQTPYPVGTMPTFLAADHNPGTSPPDVQSARVPVSMAA